MDRFHLKIVGVQDVGRVSYDRIKKMKQQIETLGELVNVA